MKSKTAKNKYCHFSRILRQICNIVWNLKIVSGYFIFLQLHFYIGVYSLLIEKYKISFTILYICFSVSTFVLSLICVNKSNVDNINQKLKKHPFSPTFIESLLYCSICKVFVKSRTRHCKKCRACIKRYDHHCQWLNCCIGKKNLTVFHELLLSNIAMITIHLIGILTNASFLICGKIEELDFFISCECHNIKEGLAIFGICIVPLFAFLLIYFGYMLIFNLYLHIKDITAYEYIVGIPPPSPKKFSEKVFPKTLQVGNILKGRRSTSRTDLPNLNNLAPTIDINENDDNSTNKSQFNSTYILPFRIKSARSRTSGRLFNSARQSGVAIKTQT